MGKACSKGAGYDERLDIQQMKVQRFNTEENQGGMSASMMPRDEIKKQGSFALDDSQAQPYQFERRKSTVPAPPTNVLLPPPPKAGFSAVTSSSVSYIPPVPTGVVVPPPLSQGTLGLIRTQTAIIPEDQKPPAPVGIPIPPPLPDQIRELMSQRIYQTFKKHNDKRKVQDAIQNQTRQIVALWASKSDASCLTESSYGKDMFEELRKNPLSIDKVNVKGTLKWVSNHQDDTYLYSGQMKDGIKEGLGRLQNENFLYDGEFRNDQFEGYGRQVFDWKDDDKDYWYEGQFKNGDLHGQGKRMFKDGRVEDGTFKNGTFQ